MSRPANIRILRGDLVHGPLTRQEVEQLLSAGRIVASDLMSVDNGPWVTITSQLGNATHGERTENPPPTNTVQEQADLPTPANQVATGAGSKSHEPAGAKALDSLFASLDVGTALGWTYRVAIALALVGVFLPWYTASSTISAPVLGGGSSYAAISGTSTGWGLLSLLCLVAGAVLSFLSKEWRLLCGAAAAAAVVSGLAAIQLSSSTPIGANVHSTFGGATATAGTSLGTGIWLTLIGSVVAVVVAYAQGKTHHIGTAAFHPFVDRLFSRFSSRATEHGRNSKFAGSLNDEPVSTMNALNRAKSLPQWAWGVIAGLVVVLVFVVIQSRRTGSGEGGTTSGESNIQTFPGSGGTFGVTGQSETSDQITIRIKKEAASSLQRWDRILTLCKQLDANKQRFEREYSSIWFVSRNRKLLKVSSTDEQKFFDLGNALDSFEGFSGLRAFDLYRESLDTWLTKRRDCAQLLAVLPNVVMQPADGVDALSKIRTQLAELQKSGPSLKQPYQVSDDEKKRREEEYTTYRSQKNLIALQNAKGRHEREDERRSFEVDEYNRRVREDHNRELARLRDEIVRLEKMEQDRGRPAAELNKIIVELRSSLIELPPDDLLRDWNESKKLLNDCVSMIDEWKKAIDRNAPQLPEAVVSELAYIHGVSHIIEGDLFYVDNKVIRIPTNVQDFYTGRKLDSPNRRTVFGHFAFVGNTTGTNAFGAAINGERYQVDSRVTEIARKQRAYLESTRDVRKVFDKYPSFDRNLKEATQLVRAIVGDTEFTRVVKYHDLIQK